MNGTATYECTIVYDASHQSCIKNKTKKTFWPLFGDPLKISPPKWRNPCTWQSSTIMQIFTLIGARHLSLGQKYIFFLIGDSLGATIPCHTFLESSHLDATPHLTCNAATYHFQDICCQNLGFWGPLGIPQGQTLCPGPISTSMQNFTPTGVTVTVISVTKQIHWRTELQRI